MISRGPGSDRTEDGGGIDARRKEAVDAETVASAGPRPPETPRRRPKARKLGFFGVLVILALVAVGLAFVGSAGATATCTIYWTGNTSGDWGTASNWSLTDGGPSAGRVPNSSDFVCMSTAPATASVTSSATVKVTGINWPQAGSVQPSLIVDSTMTLGTATAQNPSTIDQLEVDGTLIVSKNAATTASTLDLTGILEGPGSLTVSGPATLANNATLGAINTPATKADLILQGASSVPANGDLLFEGGSVLENQATLTLGDASQLIDEDQDGNKLVNDSAGTVSFTGSTASQTSIVGVVASNAGTVTVGKGTLDFGDNTSASASDAGTFTAASGATLDLAGTRSELSGATVAGAGTVDVTGTTTFSAASNLTNTGSFEVDGTLAVASGVAVTAANLNLKGILLGPGSLTVSGPATLANNATLGAINTPAKKADLILQGASSEPANGDLLFEGGSVLENQGTLTLGDASQLIDEDQDGNKLVNDSAGTVSFTGSTAAQTAIVGVVASNAGTVSVGEGTLDFGDNTSASASDAGTFTAASGATLDLAGTRSELSGATVAGAGTVDVTGTTTVGAASSLTNSGTLKVDGTLAVSSGAAAVPAAFVVSGTFSVATGASVTGSTLNLSGTVQGPGSLSVSGAATFANNATLGAINTPAKKAHLILQGASSLPASATVFFEGGSVLENQGTLTLGNASNLVDEDGAGNKLVNDSAGTVSFTGSTAAQTAIVGVVASNAGTVSVGEGTLDFGDNTSASASDAGTFTAASGATLDLAGTRSELSGATVAGAGTVDVTGTTTFSAASNLTNSGTFEVDGTLAVASSVAVTAANLTLKGILLGPGSLSVSGAATLANNATLGAINTPSSKAHLILPGASSLPASATVFFEGGSVLENQGTLTLGNASNLVDEDGAGNKLVNDSAGTVSFTGSTAAQSAIVGVVASNAGTVTVGKGTLDFGDNTSASASDAGTFTAASGATLDLAGTRSELSGATVAGAGTVDVTGTTTFSAASNLTNSGTFEVDGTLAVASSVAVTAANLTLKGILLGPGSLSVSGAATLANNATLGAINTPATKADLILPGASSVSASATVFFEGGSVLENQGTLTLGNASNLVDEDGAGNKLVNDSLGTVSFTGSTTSQTATIGVSLTNNGTLTSNKGTLGVSTLTNLNGSGTLTGGTYTASGGVLSIPGSVVHNAATINAGASPSSISTGGNNALTGLTSNTGSLDLKSSLALTVALTNSGTLTVEAGTLQANSFSQTAGTTTVLSGSTLEAGTGASNIAINGGKLTGTGTLKGNLAGVGTIVPIGASGGPTTVTGTYNATGGTLSIPISGTTTAGTDFGQLSVQGAATLGGTLSFATATGFSPPIGTQYTIVKAASITGTFSSVGGAVLSDRQYLLSYNATSVVATVEPLPPTVSGVSPSSGPKVGGTSVTITGTNLDTATGVEFGSTAASSFTVDSPTEISATTPAGAGTVDVTVTNPGGTSATSPSDQYTYVPAPTVSAVTPSSGRAAGGTSVKITGTNLSNAVAVSFGANPATTFTVNSATQITATAPAGSGTVDVTVSTPGGTSSTSSADRYTYVPLPTVSSVSPSSGPTAGATTVTIMGTNLAGATFVKFGSAVASFTVNSSTQITAKAPAGSGVVDVTVTTAGGTSATSSADQYTYVPAPTVSGLSPSAGPVAGGTSVVITGTSLTGATGVSFGSTAATSFTVNSATQITAKAPAGSGTVDVTVTTPGGTSATSPSDQYTYVPAPTVSAVTPSSGRAAGGTSVKITGTNLSNAVAVSFGANPATTFTVNSATQITATAPAGSGTVDVTVSTPGGTSSTSSADRYTYVPLPTVSSVSPSSGPTAGATTVTIMGTNLAGATFVKFGSAVASFTVNSSTQITAKAPAGSGVVDVTVTTPGGTSATSSADQYTYVPAPTVSGLSPSAGPVAGGTSVVITGSNLTGATGVSFGSTAATSFTVNSATQITAKAPAGSGTVDVTVTTPGGTSSTSSADQFTYAPKPTISGVSPKSGPDTGGTSVAITGTNLTGATLVRFGSKAAASVTVNSATQITATTPAGTGVVNVSVTTPGGTSAVVAADQFSYISADSPTVSAVSPNAGPTTGKTVVTVTGTNFAADATVKFGTSAGTSVTVDSPTQLTVTAPAHAAATVDVTVNTSVGTSATSSADQYTYEATPTVTGISPAGGTTAGGNTVTITGSGFVSGASVEFGTTAGTGVTFDSSTQLTVTAPAHAAGPVHVTVTTAGGTSASSSKDLYTYAAAPTVTAISPTTGPTAGQTTVTITGSGFFSGAAVKFGTIASSSVTVSSQTQIKAVAPAAAAGTVNVTVTTPVGTSATTLKDLYAYGSPTVTSFTPASGNTGSSVTVSGTGFSLGVSVKFGSLSSPTVTVVSGTSLKAVVPNGAVQAAITVTDAQGSATSTTQYQPKLSITGLSPTSGAAGTVVTISGVGFNSSSTVKFNGTAATGVTLVSSSQLKATVPAGATTGPVTVTNTTTPAGTVTSPSSFTAS